MLVAPSADDSTPTTLRSHEPYALTTRRSPSTAKSRQSVRRARCPPIRCAGSSPVAPPAQPTITSCLFEAATESQAGSRHVRVVASPGKLDRIAWRLRWDAVSLQLRRRGGPLLDAGPRPRQRVAHQRSDVALAQVTKLLRAAAAGRGVLRPPARSRRTTWGRAAHRGKAPGVAQRTRSDRPAVSVPGGFSAAGLPRTLPRWSARSWPCIPAATCSAAA